MARGLIVGETYYYYDTHYRGPSFGIVEYLGKVGKERILLKAIDDYGMSMTHKGETWDTEYTEFVHKKLTNDKVNMRRIIMGLFGGTDYKSSANFSYLERVLQSREYFGFNK